MNQAIQECVCQSCRHVWHTSEEGLRRPCPQCGSHTFLYQPVTQAALRAAKRAEASSRWPLRVDIAVGVLLAWLVIVLVSVIGVVAFWTLAADAVQDGLEGGTPEPAEVVGQPTADVVAELGSASYTCADGRTLHWNDTGWGYEGGTWEAHAREDGQLVPPQAELDAC